MLLADVAPVTETEAVPTAQAENRVTAEPISAPVSLPPFAAAAMDGFALRSTELIGHPPFRFNIGGQSLAGHPYQGDIPRGTALRIFTGAPVPTALDAVVIQEDCDFSNERVLVREAVTRGANVRLAGHDIREGQILAPQATRLSAFHLGWMSACGVVSLKVFRRPRVALFSTGDELVEPGRNLAPGQIYDANRHLLRALLSRLPVSVEDLGILRDDPQQIRNALQAAGNSCDAIITSGGVSVGDADLVKAVLEQMGDLQFWKLNLKPGKPMTYGRLGHALFFGLPGNPVSAAVTALMLVKPAILRLCGCAYQPPLSVLARLLTPIEHRSGREEFQRGILHQQDGDLTVVTTGDQSSNRLATFAEANCLIRIPKLAETLQTGTQVLVLPFSGLL